ncbi:hypothetical protein [Hymenobacter elongatus]|uniref:Haem-binding uptake Tiki superfamily ChaN domain-containing protein n=1 Tax=Hymenobacter elongatus TaxID=877208 RepID=A0A4Z0PRV4_9BACT|nr:hypothetical protein [Hymenobacter elongatus]TGE20049.1 hypothetical protein E5J99_00330 [Hymenobacter elongatus]
MLRSASTNRPASAASFTTACRLVLAGVASLLTSATAQAQDSTMTRLIQKNQFPLVQTGPQFSGTGWDQLQQEVAKSQFVMVGEMHGTAQIPQFTGALAQVLQPKIFVSEIDRYQAQDLSQLVAQPGAPAAYLQQYPMSLSFYSWAEEFALARQLHAQKVQLLGIDQVNGFTVGRFYTRLAEQSKRKATKTYLLQRAAAYQATDRVEMTSKDQKMTMMHQPPSALDSLVAMTRQESPAVQRMVQEYVSSIRIYQTSAQASTGLQSHKERIGMMKRNLMQDLRPYQPTGTEALPKMLLKFGAEHGARNLSFIGVFDVGNLVTNLADMQNHKSLHVMVLGKQGTTTAGFDSDIRKNTHAYQPDADNAYKLFYDQTTASAWNVVDLRPLRRALLGRKLQVADLKLERTILGYDYLVIIPQTTANPAF